MAKRTCPKCGSNNIHYEIVSHTYTKNHHHGIFWWLIIGWWWIPVKWFCFTGLAIFLFILKICGIRRKDYILVTKPTAVCQECGHYWEY